MMKIFYRFILLVLLIIGPWLIHASANAAVIVCNAMVGDGSTDNSKALNACMKAAKNQPEKTVKIPSAARAYKVSSTFGNYLTVPEGVSLVGQEGAKLNATLRLSDNSVLDNIDFTDGQRRVIIGETSFVKGAEVRNCKFGDSTWASIIAYRANDCLVYNNTFNNKKKGQNILFHSGKRNTISYNSISGGRTAILFLYFRNVNGGGYKSIIEGNIIEHNTVHDVRAHQYDEGISFDCAGDGTAHTAALEYDKVSYASGKKVILSHANWKRSGNPSYVGYDMVFLSGDLIGQTRRIAAQSGATFTLDKSVSGAAKGDKITIGATFKRNIVRNNKINSPNLDDAILIYGMGFQNIIDNNTLARGANISIVSADNLVVSKGSVTRTWGRAPCGYNLVKGNSVGGKIILSRYAWPVMKGHKNTYSPYYSYGNSVIDNKLRVATRAVYQYLIFSRNTGTTEFHHVNIIDKDEGSIGQPSKHQTIEPPQGLRILSN
jgi:hypothetical protein